jgi:hypothetical protein
VVRLSIRKELLTEPAMEAWLREHVIDRMLKSRATGGGNAGA